VVSLRLPAASAQREDTRPAGASPTAGPSRAPTCFLLKYVREFYIDYASLVPAVERPLTVTRAGILGTIATFIVVVVCARLGFWQLDRLEQKQERNAAAHARAAQPHVRLGSAARDTAGMIFRRAIVTGVYDDAHTIIVAGRSFRGTPGVYVLTPLRVGGSAVFINRGFTPSADAAHVDIAKLREPAPDSLEGLIMYLGQDENPVARDRAFKRIWYRPSIAQLRAQSPYPVASYVVQLLPAPGAPESPTRLPAPALDEGPHLGYAIQWFSFALIFVIGWAVLVFRKKQGGA
jgi:surfeit locus 1 family protein